MIRLILTGGLGNQMFEYAAAKSLALRLNKELTIDMYALNKKTKGIRRSFELDIFTEKLNISSSWQTLFLVKVFPIVERNRKLFQYLFGYFRDRSAIVYLPEFEKLEGDIILHGHFQNERYFENYEQEIRETFIFKKPLEKENLQIANKISETQSIAIHIRRGDYLTDSNFALCSKEYYQEAIKKICEGVEYPYFYIFSEDFDWISENITFGDKPYQFVDCNKDENSYIDMQLMSLCKHNIIANSSFSWWAAWLNTNAEKIVYAPSQWFGEEMRNKDLADFYPKNWNII